MRKTSGRFLFALGLAVCLAGGALYAAGAPGYASHTPMRPLPTPSDRAMEKGPALFVDAVKGNDAGDGSEARPWKSLQQAVKRLKPGDTLYLRGGTYYERVHLTQSGTAEQPVTVRAYPGELAIVDGGLREFYETPADAWQPCPDGAKDEFISTRAYPDADQRVAPNQFISIAWEPLLGKEDERPLALGQFGDSMIPLHGYRLLADLRSTNEFWETAGKDKTGKSKAGKAPAASSKTPAEGIYFGPGLWYDRDTGRIHIRLAHTQLEGLGDRAYSGETDPRKLPLVVAIGFGDDVIRVNGVKNVRLQDLVFRGATGSPLVNVYGAEDISLDRCTLYGGFPCLLVNASARVKLTNSALRSLAAPWSSRASMKYRGTASYALITQAGQPLNHDFEFAYNEITDGHDCIHIREVNNLQFHHNFVENFNDDGIEVGPKRRLQELYIHENLLRQINMTFSLHEMDKDESPLDPNMPKGVFIYRNIIDLRKGIYGTPPNSPDPTGAFLDSENRLCSDHGGPIWPVYYFYQNTVIAPHAPWRDYYGHGMGVQGNFGNKRWVFNNIFLTVDGLPGRALTFVPGYQIDGNLHWGARKGPAFTGDYFEKFRKSKAFEESKKEYAPGWTANDVFADPKFVSFSEDWREPSDFRLRKDSPAVNAGAPIPEKPVAQGPVTKRSPAANAGGPITEQLPDPLRDKDAGKPDIGAVPVGVEPWAIGVSGRLTVFGPAK